MDCAYHQTRPNVLPVARPVALAAIPRPVNRHQTPPRRRGSHVRRKWCHKFYIRSHDETGHVMRFISECCEINLTMLALAFHRRSS